MAEQRTKPTPVRVEDFLNGLEDDQVKKDCFILKKILTELSGFEPRMWGTSIVGFGSYHYKYESGREGDMPLIAFSPRKKEITLYLSSAFENRDELLQQLGKHKTSKACIYVKRLSDINIDVLKKMIRNSLQRKGHGC